MLKIYEYIKDLYIKNKYYFILLIFYAIMIFYGIFLGFLEISKGSIMNFIFITLGLIFFSFIIYKIFKYIGKLIIPMLRDYKEQINFILIILIVSLILIIVILNIKVILPILLSTKGLLIVIIIILLAITYKLFKK